MRIPQKFLRGLAPDNATVHCLPCQDAHFGEIEADVEWLEPLNADQKVSLPQTSVDFEINYLHSFRLNVARRVLKYS